MQVYRGMDIGTAKPSAAIRAEIPHLMVDVCEPEDPYTVADFRRDGLAALDEMGEQGTRVIVAGGSGLHFRSVVDPLSFPPTDAGLRERLEEMEPAALVAELLAADPAVAALVDLDNPRRVARAVEILRLTGETPSGRAAGEAASMVRSYRPERPVVAIGFDPGEATRERVTARFDAMLEAGLVDEVRALRPRLGPTARQAVGYKELLPHVEGEVSQDAARRTAITATVKLAKRQRTFFRRDPRIRWLPWHDDLAVRVASAVDVFEEVSWTS
jgi:tRNA dimethylallyltransferase